MGAGPKWHLSDYGYNRLFAACHTVNNECDAFDPMGLIGVLSTSDRFAAARASIATP